MFHSVLLLKPVSLILVLSIDVMRISCCVPGCKRTCSADRFGSEWLCAKHWPLVAKGIKADHRLVVRRLCRKPTSMYLQRLEFEAWQACRADAIEKAFGIR